MSSYRVLIAEDEGLIAHDIAGRLEALGHRVVGTASTAEEALELAAGADVVLMDIRLDGPRDGIDAAQEIRARHHLPVIFLTAHADRRTLERAKLTGPFGYIVKPMAPAALQTTLEIAMYKHAMERHLEEREAWLTTTLRAVADAVVVTDAQGRAILANPAAETLLGLAAGGSAADLANLDVAKLLPGDPVALAILRDAPVAIETTILNQMLEGSAAPVKAAGAIIGCVVTLRNVTLQRWQEQQLRQAQKMEAAGKLAGSVAGQYASLLAIIAQESQRLLSRLALPSSGPSSVRQSLDAIRQAALEAQEINSRLAGLGARATGQPQPVSMNGILRRMRKTLDSIAGSHVRLALHADPAMPKIYADPGQMEQMILGVVTLISSVAPRESGAPKENDAVTIETVSETSTGQLRLAVSFAGASTEALDAATNLELNLASSIAADCGGMITLERTPQRTAVTILLPAWHEPEPAPASVQTPRTLLLIEPRESVRRQLHNFFEAAGYNMLEASNREEAVALLELHAPSGGEGPGETIDLVLGDSQVTRGMDQAPVLLTDQPPGRALSQSELLERVRSRLQPDLTFSASA